MVKRKESKKKSKNPLQYAITPEFEQEIREYIDEAHRKTGLPKSRIASNFLLESVRRAKNFYPCNSENSEMANA